ncbi:ERF family protein [Salinithrix halophila]|uniref:ERF family protein n=1 Tax=Salinithrix halophila TaxID=1485204 RepID=A0ABV8JE11_9BACL
MKTSENTQEICKALVAFHGEVGRITKDGQNPHLKNRYATIDQIIEEIRPILASHGLFIMQMPTNTEAGEIQMTTRIFHTSGQWMESPVLTLKPQKMDPQGIGSAVTYARRYSLTSFLSLNTGEDDDGNSASAPTQQRKVPAKGKAPAAQKPGQKAGGPQGLASQDQRRKLFAKGCTEKGLTKDQLKKLVNYQTGKDSTVKLTPKEIDDLVKLIEAMDGAELVQLIGEKALESAVNTGPIQPEELEGLK